MSVTANQVLSQNGPGRDFTFKALVRGVDDFTVEWCLPPIWQNPRVEAGQIEQPRSRGDEDPAREAEL
jgi:hypothetical protein